MLIFGTNFKTSDYLRDRPSFHTCKFWTHLRQGCHLAFLKLFARTKIGMPLLCLVWRKITSFSDILKISLIFFWNLPLWISFFRIWPLLNYMYSWKIWPIILLNLETLTSKIYITVAKQQNRNVIIINVVYCIQISKLMFSK